MQTGFQRWRQSASFKAATIGFLVLVLLIPLSMIEGVIHERSATRDAAAADIMRTWGAAQLVAGPVVILPYRTVRVTKDGERIVGKAKAYLLPEQLHVDAAMRPEIRYRGLYEVPVYGADLAFSGSIASPDLDALQIPAEDVLWDEAYVVVAISDAKAITETPTLTVGGHRVRFGPGSESLGGLLAPIRAPIGAFLDEPGSPVALDFDFTLRLNGAEVLRFAPLGDTTSIAVRSNWPSPSFVGNYLPESREVRDDGFEASWKVSNIGRALPSQWTSQESVSADLAQSAFGVRLYQPVSLYQLTLRAAKYGVLFVGLTFVAYFLFEVVGGLSLHPLQYLLVGMGNALFFLLLLSLAEHIGFGRAYLASAAASSALIAGYSRAVLGARSRAWIMTGILGLLYLLLYMILNAESYALLAGSVGLWLALALTMYLTRRIDWYAAGRVRDELD